MHVHMNACLTLLHHSTYASMHDHIICTFIVKQRKQKKGNLNPTCQRRTNNQTEKQGLKYIKRDKNRSM